MELPPSQVRAPKAESPDAEQYVTLDQAAAMNLNDLLKAPVGTPSPLSEVYDAVADAVFVAAGMIEQAKAGTLQDKLSVEGATCAFADSRSTAIELLKVNEVWLAGNAPEALAEFNAALQAIEPINHACSHLRSDPPFCLNVKDHWEGCFRHCSDYHQGCPRSLSSLAIDERAILAKMRGRTIEAASRLAAKSDAGNGAIQTTAAEVPPATPTNHPIVALLRVFTEGVSDDRFREASRLLIDDSLTADEKLWKIDALIKFPASASAAKLGKLLKVSGSAIKNTSWWKKNRKGKKQEETVRREDQHKKRAEQRDKADESGDGE